MSALALPPREESSRELMRQARLVERLGRQRREQLKRLEALDASIREARRMFRALTDLLMTQVPEEPQPPIDQVEPAP